MTIFGQAIFPANDGGVVARSEPTVTPTREPNIFPANAYPTQYVPVPGKQGNPGILVLAAGQSVPPAGTPAGTFVVRLLS